MTASFHEQGSNEDTLVNFIMKSVENVKQNALLSATKSGKGEQDSK